MEKEQIMEFKGLIVKFCENFIEEKLKIQQDQIARAKQSLEGSSKSSAGDKHETSRAMAQLEMEKAGAQYQRLLQEKELQERVNALALTRSTQVSLGSLIQSAKGWFFIGISIGPVQISDENVIIISGKSPLGAGFIGKTVGEFNSFNAVEIQAIF